MGCTSSKENSNSSTTTTVSDNNQQLINDNFRTWLKSNRPKADEYVLNDIISTAQQQSNDIDDYRTIVSKALDLLSEHHDIKTTNKLSKLVQKEISLASPKKIAHTIDVLKQTAEKLRHGQIILDNNQQQTRTTNDEIINDTNKSENKHSQISSSGEPGINLKEALEKARILFYKGKQAAIFANPSGGYIVKIIDDNDDALNHDGNLLRSIIVTEVKMRPKLVTKNSSQFSTTPQPPPPPPPPPPSKLLDEYEIGDDFRRSIDAALKGLEAIYQTSPSVSSQPTQEIHINKKSSSNVTKSTSEDNTINLTEMDHQKKVIRNINDEEQQAISQIDIQPKLVNAIDDMNEIMLDIIETTTESEIGNPVSSTHVDMLEKITNVERIVKEVKEHGEIHETKESLPINQHSSYPLGVTLAGQNEESPTSSILQQQVQLSDDNRLQSFIAKEEKLDKDEYNFNQQKSLDELTPTDLSNIILPTSKLDISTLLDKIEKESIINNESSSKTPTSTSSIIENHNKILFESSSPPIASFTDMNTISAKSPSHNVTYTEIIHSESRDGEQSRRFITESYDDHPSTTDDETTTLKVVTKSEFSNHPTLGEKIMEQSVQVITVKVRNETITTRNSSQTSDNDITYDKQSIKNDVNTIDMTI
ncbi:unnamed protein product [Rotaria sp. Silwood2]|nr:unnamed protein product [Rotaria sp. Silwood2]CAF4103433.1 unnamed protein product [Rotaria sp. Silwood2]